MANQAQQQIQLIQTKNVHQRTKTAMESQITRNSICLFIISVIGLTAPFWHSFYGVSTNEGVFGYKYMSSFLYALGHPVFAICMGMLMLFAAKQLTLNFSKPFRLISFLMLGVGCYQLLAVLVSKKMLLHLFGVRDFANWVYYLVMVVIALFVVVLVQQIQFAIFSIERVLKVKIRLLVGFVLKHNSDNDEAWEVLDKVSN